MKNGKSAKIKIAAIGDLHAHDASAGFYHQLFIDVSDKADVLVLCGDLTDRGLISEAKVLATELASCKIPVVGVLGNHDYDSGQAEDVKDILRASHLAFLEDENVEVNGVGFAGVKGFCGGFGTHILGPFGESAIKDFAQEGVWEALKLENSLSRLRTPKKIIVLHYAPITATIEGEPLEIFPFLGTSRLEEPIDRFGVSAVFHGHADYGKPFGKTAKGIPVYNVALPLLKRISPKQTYALIEI